MSLLRNVSKEMKICKNLKMYTTKPVQIVWVSWENKIEAVLEFGFVVGQYGCQSEFSDKFWLRSLLSDLENM